MPAAVDSQLEMDGQTSISLQGSRNFHKNCAVTGPSSCIFGPMKHKMLYVIEKNETFFILFLTNELVWIS
jgi:hypothetical protein